MRNGRMRASVAACVAAAGCMAMDVPMRGDLEDAAADRAVAEMRRRVLDEARSMRDALDAAEAGRDWRELLERKRSVDGWLSPMHLVRDAMRAAVPGAACDLLAAWRVEWRDGPVREEWSHPDAASRVRASLAAWVPRPGSGEAIRLEALTASCRWVGCDAPASCAWTADGSWGALGPSVHGRCWWRLPLAERIRVDLPLAGDGMDLWWDDRGARYQDDRGGSHAETWPSRPYFCNPPSLFAAFDSLRAAAAPDAPCNPDPACAAACTVEGAEGRTIERSRRVLASDGRTVREDRWRWTNGRLEEVHVRMHALRTVHHAERAVRLSSEVEGRVLEQGEHRPVSEVVDFPDGGSVTIAFRAPIDGIDRCRDPLDRSASVPASIVLEERGSAVVRARFRSVRLGPADALDGHACGRHEALRRESAAHRALADRAESAIASRSDADAADAIASIAAMHASAGSESRSLADEMRLIGDRLDAAGMPRPAAIAAARPGTDGASPRGSVPCGGPDDVLPAHRHAPAPISGTRPSDCGCPDRGAALLCRAADEALRSAGLTDAWPACVRAALCAARQAPDDGTAPVGEAVAHRVATDLAVALRAGAIDPGEAPVAESCETFAAMVVEVARRRMPDPDDARRRLVAIEAACAGARLAMERALDAELRGAARLGAGPGRAEALAAFDGVALRRRSLAGNAFVEPARDPVDPISDPATAHARAAADDAIGAAVEHEARRVDALRGSAGEGIAEARRRSAYRRIASVAMQAVERAIG